ncbi:MAG: NAD(P)H-binding protein [Deltaproteobacteria bacterium]|nr:NAD(P)H-binding protein [Deltaproteobacteria bacterium]
MKPILLLGATGFTGKLCAAALDRLEVPYILAGRNPDKLQALQKNCTHAQGFRQVDVKDPTSLQKGFEDISVVLSTVGPFRRYGMPVVQAAIKAGAHYVDTAAEQPFMNSVYNEHHQEALDKNLTLLTGHACDFTFAYLGAALADEAVGEMTRCHSYHGLDPFRPSPGTAVSALEMIKAPYLTYASGQFTKQPRKWRSQAVGLPGVGNRYHAVPFPGGDTVLLPHHYPALLSCSSDLLLPQKEAEGFAGFDFFRPLLSVLTPGFVINQASRLLQNKLPHPTEEERQEGLWHVVVEGGNADKSTRVLIQGNDVYGISGACAALGASWLRQNKARTAGVTTTGRAFDARAFLKELAPLGVTWSLNPA